MPARRQKTATRVERVMIAMKLDEQLVKRLNAEAVRRGLTRTALVTVLLSEALEGQSRG